MIEVVRQPHVAGSERGGERRFLCGENGGGDHDRGT
jgi:hypothetical protein